MVDADEVRRRAYELYLAAGSEPGLATCHWEQAQAILGAATAAPAPDARRFLILVRHASRHRTPAPENVHRMDGWPAGQSPTKAVPTDDGLASRKSGWLKTRSIAIALADQLAAEKVRVTHILHSNHEVARQTALVYAAVLCRAGAAVVGSCAWLAPEDRDGLARALEGTELDDLWTQPGPPRGPDELEWNGRAIVLVGHQPQLTAIADGVLRRSWRKPVRRALPLPVGGGEAACLRLGTWPRLRWMLSEKSDVGAELKDKLRSKVETAKFFLGALAVNAAILLNTSVWSTAGPSQLWVLAGGGLLIFAGLLLAVATLLGYDALNMPPAFWSEAGSGGRRDAPLPCDVDPPSRSVLRPPSEASVVLFFEMVKTWTRFFVPALFCSVAGVSLFLLSLVMSRRDLLVATGGRPPAPPPSPATAMPVPMDGPWWASAGAVLIVVAIVVTVAYRRWGPRLGTED
jgi:phosphohistidine phosphatase SixA